MKGKTKALCPICGKVQKIRRVVMKLGLKGSKTKKILADAEQCQVCSNPITINVTGVAR